MRQFLDYLFDQSTYRFWRLKALSPVAGRVLDEADYHLLFLLWPAQLESYRVFFL